MPNTRLIRRRPLTQLLDQALANNSTSVTTPSVNGMAWGPDGLTGAGQGPGALPSGPPPTQLGVGTSGSAPVALPSAPSGGGGGIGLPEFITHPMGRNEAHNPLFRDTPKPPPSEISAYPATPAAKTLPDIMGQEIPKTADSATLLKFHNDRLAQLGRFYNMPEGQLSKKMLAIQAEIAPMLLNPDLPPNQVRSYINDLYNSTAKQVAKDYDTSGFGADGVDKDPTATTADATKMPANPLSQYGVYTPEQIAAIQGQIGQYLGNQQQAMTAATGFTPDAQTIAAYNAQAQAIPAISALEGQASLAKQLAAAQQQNQYYQLLSQMSQASAAGTPMTPEQLALANGVDPASVGLTGS